MINDDIVLIGIIVVAVVLLCAAIHFLARFVSIRWPIALPINEQLRTRPSMGRILRYALGILCLSFGGLWCIGLFFSRVDPPEVASANMAAVIAAAIVAAGINLIGRAIITGSAYEEKGINVVWGLAFATWFGISIGLDAWHQMILHIRKTQSAEAIQIMQIEEPEPSDPSNPLTPSAQGTDGR